MSLRTSCCAFPQKEQYSVFLEDSLFVASLVIFLSFHGRPPMVWLKGRHINLSRKPTAASALVHTTHAYETQIRKTWQ